MHCYDCCFVYTIFSLPKCSRSLLALYHSTCCQIEQTQICHTIMLFSFYLPILSSMPSVCVCFVYVWLRRLSRPTLYGRHRVLFVEMGKGDRNLEKLMLREIFDLCVCAIWHIAMRWDVGGGYSAHKQRDEGNKICSKMVHTYSMWSYSRLSNVNIDVYTISQAYTLYKQTARHSWWMLPIELFKFSNSYIFHVTSLTIFCVRRVNKIL